MRLLLAVLVLGLAAPAHATTGLAWQWPAEGRRFLLGSRVTLPGATPFYAEKNDEFRAKVVEFDVITTCVPTAPPTKAGVKLACTLDAVTIRADAFEPDKVVPVLSELDDRLTGAIIAISVDPQGRLRAIDLEGVDKSNVRLSAIHETSRLLLARAFALLDFELPKGGDDKGRGAWRANDTLATKFPSSTGTMGAVALDSIVEKTDGALVSILTKGRGMVQSSEVAPGDKPLYTWDVVYEGTATFDTASGRLIERAFVVDGQPTAGSAGRGQGGGAYVQHARLVALGAGEKPELPASGPLPPG